MEIVSQSGIAYRTALMTLEAAARFARCLSANSRFTAVEIATSTRAKGEKRHFVTFMPSNPTRVAAMLDRQQNARARRACEEAFTFCRDSEHNFHWCHSHKSGEVYEVTERSCNCPDAELRLKGTGIRCKHSLALMNVEPEAVQEFRVIPSPERRKFDAQRFAEIFG